MSNAQSWFKQIALTLTVGAVLTVPAMAEDEVPPSPPTAELQTRNVKVDIDSGLRRNNSMKPRVVFDQVVTIDDAAWARLKFANTQLPVGIDGTPSRLRLTSLLDGGVQLLNDETLWQWQSTSAYFNGDSVRVELILAPRAQGRVAIDLVMVNDGDGIDILTSQCGPTDDRLPSTDPRAARGVPVGCTVNMIDDFNHQFLTAGHCVSGGNMDVVQFNVPLSNGNGNINHPGPEDQYAVDPESMQFTNGGVGNDWSYFGVFNNSTTGLSPYEAQGDFFIVAKSAPPVNGQSIRITGYGVDSSPPEWNQTQQTHAGPYFAKNGTQLQYRADTMGGNSGSAVQNDDEGVVIGIHTHGGCQTNGSGANSGTAIEHPGLQFALANPRGVCAPQISFEFPDGLPDMIQPSGGDTLVVTIEGEGPAEPVPGTGLMHVNTGGGFMDVPLIEIGQNTYEVTFPASTCASTVLFYFSVETANGSIIDHPLDGASNPYQVMSAVDVTTSFADDFESDLGWSVSGDAVDGQWDRGVPIGGGDRGDPPTDADGSGRCYLTDNVDGNSDVDDGYTILTSPMLDASQGAPIVRYYRWYSNTTGGDPENDIFEVEVSDDNGASWVDLETVGPAGSEVNGGWYQRSFALDGVIDATNSVRIRFMASDLAGGSVIEAGVDGFELLSVSCDSTALTGFNVLRGTLLSGGLSDLVDADDSYLRVRSQFGVSVLEPNVAELEVNAQTTMNAPQFVDLAIESRISQPGGNATVSMRRADNGQFAVVGQFPIGIPEVRQEFNGLDGVLFVNNGMMTVRVKYVVMAAFSALGFDTSVDQVGLAVH